MHIVDSSGAYIYELCDSKVVRQAFKKFMAAVQWKCTKEASEAWGFQVTCRKKLQHHPHVLRLVWHSHTLHKHNHTLHKHSHPS